MSATSTRRDFFKVAASAVGIGSGLRFLGAKPAWAAQNTASKSPLRITEIERHEVVLPFNDYNATTLYRCQGSGLMTRTIFVAKTNVGIEGYGEGLGSAWLPPEDLEPYVGTSPFDWVGHDTPLPLSMVFYDLMGKHLGLPAWKLIGPKVRSWVPVSAWTEPQTPDAMAEEVRQAVRRGYHWLKFHVNQCQDVVDQTEAMQKVAPPGFKVHYDFNADSNLEAIAPVLRELERFTIAARAEDPVVPTDHDAYRLLRETSRLSILLHHAPMEVMMKNVCDGYMAGHASIGVAARAATIAEATNTPFMLQQAGGTINLAFLAHEVAVFKMAVLDHVHLANLWKDDVTKERFSVVGGSIAVPKGPGLGVTLDREKLEKYETVPAPTPIRLLARVQYKNGLTILFRHNPEESGALLNLRSLARVGVPGPVPGYRNQVLTKFWEADGTAAFESAWEKTASGPHWIPPERSPRQEGAP